MQNRLLHIDPKNLVSNIFKSVFDLARCLKTEYSICILILSDVGCFFIRNFIESASNCTRCTRCGRHKRTRLVGGVCVKCVNKRRCLECQFYKSKRYFSAGRERCNGCVRQAGESRKAVGHTFVEVDLPLPPDSTELTASIRLHEADIIRQISEEIEING